jgi:hypothetical protein
VVEIAGITAVLLLIVIFPLTSFPQVGAYDTDVYCKDLQHVGGGAHLAADKCASTLY